MRSSAFSALSLLAVVGPGLILAQQPLQEIDEGDGSFGIGYAAPAAPPAAPAPPAPPAPPAAKAAPSSTTLVAVVTPAGNIELKVDAATPTPSPTPTTPPTPVQPVANDADWTSVCGPGSTGTAVTISVTNSHTVPVSMWLGGQTAIGDPSPTAVAMAAATSFVYPPCVAGNMGFDEVTRGNPDASLIEFSTNYQINVDVSYVSGYSVPITCYTDNNVAFVGCNKDLWSLAKASGIPCPGTTSSDGHTCSNPSNLANGGYGPPQFFQPCAGAAYTWPNDNNADKGATPVVSCCIGTACAPGPAPVAVEQAVTYKIKGRNSEPAVSVPDTSAHLHRHKHRHGLKRAHAHHFSG